MQQTQLKQVGIDEVELLLNLAKALTPELINGLNYGEIAEFIQHKFNIECSKEDIFLLHEPTIQDEQLDMEIFYRNLGL